MAERLTRQLVAEKAIVHEAPVLRAARPGIATTVDRSFEMPTALYAATAGLFLATVAVMGFGFASPGIVVPMGIIVVFIAMFFGVAAMWVRMKPDHPGRATSWARFQRDGIMTPFGRCSANAATVQVLILPALIFLWGIAVVTIAALVR